MVKPVLEIREVSKRYPGVLALDRVSLTVLPGEVHVIAGENGAGKSTLMKLLAQVERVDDGVVLIDGKPVEFRGPRFAQLVLGISMVHQELALAPHLTVADNLCLGDESTRLGVLSPRADHRRASALLARVNLAVDPGRLVSTLPVADRQRVEIAKALGGAPRIVIMDEPTAMLTEVETGDLFSVIAELKAHGIAIVYISHRLDEVAHLADRVTVLRDGRVVQTLHSAQVSPERLVRLMVGRDIANLYRKPRVEIGDVLLRAEGISRRGRLVDLVECTVEVRAGEIVGFAGLVGAGRTELARAIFGADTPNAGRVLLRGREVHICSPRQGIDAGLGYLTEDRQREGLAVTLPIDQNITLANVPLRFGLIDLRAERNIALFWRDQLGITTPSITRLVRVLSGGNQQKVVLAKWLQTQSQVLLFDEPARGIDVGAKAEMFDLIGRLASAGRGIVLISSYLPELLTMCDRIIVLRAGRITGELTREQFSEERVMGLATGGAAGSVVGRAAPVRPNDNSGRGGTLMSEANPRGSERRRNPWSDAWRDRVRAAVSQLAAAGAVVVLFGYLSLASGAFLSANNLFNIGVQSAVVAIIAIGMTMVIITAGIDLSVGSVAALSGVLGAMMVVDYGVPVPLAIVTGVAIGALAGVVNGVLVTRAAMAPFIATLGMLSVARGLGYIVTGSVAVSGAPPEFKLLGQGKIGSLPIPILALVIVALAGHFVLTRTTLGRYAYAIGSNVEAARLSGIPVKRYLTIVYIISGVLAGVGGMIAASRVNSGQPNFGIGLELDVIAATVIGGASLFGGEGKVIGTLLGALLIALIRNGSVLLDINTFYQQVIIGVIIWIAVCWDRYRRRASESIQASRQTP